MKYSLFLFLFSVITFFSMAQQSNDSIAEGMISEQYLASHYTWFNENKSTYIPHDSTIRALIPLMNAISFIVVLGTWCSDSKEHVPPFFNVMQALKISDANIKIIGVDRKKQTKLADVSQYSIEYVPTFIVMRNNKEIGRIVEDTKASMEKDLLEILLGTQTK